MERFKKTNAQNALMVTDALHKTMRQLIEIDQKEILDVEAMSGILKFFIESIALADINVKNVLFLLNKNLIDQVTEYKNDIKEKKIRR